MNKNIIAFARNLRLPPSLIQPRKKQVTTDKGTPCWDVYRNGAWACIGYGHTEQQALEWALFKHPQWSGRALTASPMMR